MDTSYMSGSGQYPPYFVGMKVEVGIPLSDNTTFRDWAIINEFDEDLVSLQLSRDILPSGVSLRIGQILTIRSEHDFQIYVCRAFIVSKGFEQELLLRLTGEIVANELREFYRIDAFLPIKFIRLAEEDLDAAQKRWSERRRTRREEECNRERRRQEARREKLRAEEAAREQRIREGAPSVAPAESPLDRLREESEENEYYESWRTVTSVAVNIGGGGLRISTGQGFLADELIMLEIFVPPMHRIVDVVARVIFSRRDEAGEGEKRFTTGLQFMFIDESARSSINQHLTGVQLKRIRQFKGFTDVEPAGGYTRSGADRHYAYLDTVEPALSPDQDGGRRKRWRQLLLGALFAAIACLLYQYFSGYAAGHPKNAIHLMFETGIRKLRGER
jgi:hypothetical protein